MSRDRDPTAAEYALRLLTGDELREADKRLEGDPEFAREVARWRGRLAPLHQEVEGVSPPAPLWERIAAGIGTALPANDNLAQLRRRVRVWRVVAGTMTAIALVTAAEGDRLGLPNLSTISIGPVEWIFPASPVYLVAPWWVLVSSLSGGHAAVCTC